MVALSYAGIVIFGFLISAARSTLLCYDCDAGRQCHDPIFHNVRTVNCAKQYPLEINNGQHVCLTLDISFSGTKGFQMYKSGYYRGCRVIPNGEEATFCDDMKTKYADRLVINSCKYCNTTRCIP